MVVLHPFITQPARRQTETGKILPLTGLYHYALALLLAIAILNAGALKTHAATSSFADFTKLIDWMREGISEVPLMAVGDLEEVFSSEAHQSNLEYIHHHPELIRSIRSQLDSAELSWELTDTRRRLLAVPEKRAAYAALFEQYCREVIDYVMASTGLRSPYSAIFTLSDEMVPDLSAESGISVLLVHNLAEESVYTYSFQGAGEESVAVELNQTFFTGELGSYTSRLISGGDGRFEFEPGRLTIWQNAAANPYSVLMVPVEETLHILLRGATEQAIKAGLDKHSKGEAEPHMVVEEWVAVEEAIAGGLVNQLLPDYLEQHVDGFRNDWIEDDLTLKQQLNRYRYLEKGILVVNQLGVTRALTLYQINPNEFRSMILAVQNGNDASAPSQAEFQVQR